MSADAPPALLRPPVGPMLPAEDRLSATCPCDGGRPPTLCSLGAAGTPSSIEGRCRCESGRGRSRSMPRKWDVVFVARSTMGMTVRSLTNSEPSAR